MTQMSGIRSKTTTTLCVFEPKWKGGGHHPSWFKELVAQWLMQGYKVIAFCPAPGEVLEVLNERLTPPQRSRLTLHKVPDQSELLGRWTHSPFRMFRVLWMAKKYSRILEKETQGVLPAETPMYFGLMDLFALKIRGLGRKTARCFSHPFVGLYFFPAQQRAFPACLILDDLGYFRDETCKAVLVLNEGVRGDLENRLGKPVWALPDFLAGNVAAPQASRGARSPAKQLQEAARGRRIVLLVGDIMPRKGVMAFLDLAEACRELPWCFVLAGHIHLDSFSRQELERIYAAPSRGNMLLYPHRIESDREFHDLVASADVLYAAYPDFPHSSNQLILSASHRIPILVAEGYLMAQRTRDFHLGRACPYGDNAAMLDAVRSLMEADQRWFSEFHSGCREYCKAHSAETFAREVARICTGGNLRP